MPIHDTLGKGIPTSMAGKALRQISGIWQGLASKQTGEKLHIYAIVGNWIVVVVVTNSIFIHNPQYLNYYIIGIPPNQLIGPARGNFHPFALFERERIEFIGDFLNYFNILYLCRNIIFFIY